MSAEADLFSELAETETSVVIDRVMTADGEFLEVTVPQDMTLFTGDRLIINIIRAPRPEPIPIVGLEGLSFPPRPGLHRSPYERNKWFDRIIALMPDRVVTAAEMTDIMTNGSTDTALRDRVRAFVEKDMEKLNGFRRLDMVDHRRPSRYRLPRPIITQT